MTTSMGYAYGKAVGYDHEAKTVSLGKKVVAESIKTLAEAHSFAKEAFHYQTTLPVDLRA